MSRFSLEMVVLIITVIGFAGNWTIRSHANFLETNDTSMIFSYLRLKPGLNNPLLTTADTTTIVARSDQWVPQAQAFSVILTASQVPKNQSSSTTIQDEVIIKTNPADINPSLRHGNTIYEIQPGDTIVSIASSFGISPSTILLENKLTPTTLLKVGEKLTILPTTGVTHKILPGETTESIAQKYKISEDDLLDMNDLELPEDAQVGDLLVIPLEKVNLPPTAQPKFVKDESNKVTFKQATAPANFVGSILNFIWPTTVRSITQGFSKRHSGIDISDSKMEPTYAAADGFVEISGWQTGYGNTIVINHGNGFKTRYAHASELYVSAGEQVNKGQLIAKQGRTGRVRGATGIHLHFELVKNGVKVNPLSYVRP